MPPEQAPKRQSDGRESLRLKTRYANLVRYARSRKYFARIRVGGKLIRQSLKSKVLSVAKLKLADLETKERARLEGTQRAKGSLVSLFLAHRPLAVMLPPLD